MENIKSEIFNENQYLEEMNEMKKIYESKITELELERKRTDFFIDELLSVYGIIKLLSKTCKSDYMPLDSLFQILELLEGRLDTVINIIKENEDID